MLVLHSTGAPNFSLWRALLETPDTPASHVLLKTDRLTRKRARPTSLTHAPVAPCQVLLESNQALVGSGGGLLADGAAIALEVVASNFSRNAAKGSGGGAAFTAAAISVSLSSVQLEVGRRRWWRGPSPC
jgi:hypothetical protein